ncbi:MAG: M28 family peptidase [Xanthomonadales bacterium]|nr:M28 family peptidase [Xanthomonadales bacterium]
MLGGSPMRILLSAAIAACLGLAACAAPETPAPVAPNPTTTPAPAPKASADVSRSDTAITAADFLTHVSTLASDEFAGRAPGTEGETKTTEYISHYFASIGLKPGNGDSWYQRVPMLETTAQPASAHLSIKGKDSEWAFGSQWVATTQPGQTQITVDGSDMVFVGYGVNAPEENWNDYAGLDVKGKTVVILVNDPGFHVNDPELFGGKRMTYYGRWTYKYEEAARQGAAAAIIIHDDAGAGYGWEVVDKGWSGPQYDLPTSEAPEPRLPLQGWMTAATAQDLFAQSGLSLVALREAANKRGFKAVPLPATFSVAMTASSKETSSNNVLGLLPGSEHPDEAVVYMGHWDHLGSETDAEGHTKVFSGAIDNASGVAGIMEIAKVFAHSKTPPKRSILFLAVTLEESGLLGSKYYVAHPTFPMNKIAGVINIDAMTIVGKTRDMVVTGYGASELEDILRPITERQGRVLHAEEGVEKGFYFRSDHFNFAKAGVPALYASSGLDHVEKGEDYGRSIAAEYLAHRYHQPGDKVNPDWDLSGVVQDLQALYGVGNELANSGAWPNWYPGSPFRATRDAQRAETSSP